MDSLLISSDPALDVEARQNIGWGLIGLIGIVIFVGFAPVFVTNFKDVKTKCKARFAKKRIQRKIARARLSLD